MKTLLIAAVVLFPALANADESLTSGLTEELLEAFEPGVYHDEALSLPYRLLTPRGAGETDRRPLLVFLHGYGERGDDNKRQLMHGGKLFASPEFQSRYGAFVLAPQCPAVKRLGTDRPMTWSMALRPTDVTPTTSIEEDPSLAMRAARRLIAELMETLPIDPDRVYVAGLSMGGYGTWEMAAREPELWAAAAPICGGGNPAWGERLSKLPLWAFHGDADDAVPADRSREMVAAINAAGGRAIYTEYPGVGHGSWTPTLQSQPVWDWLFSQRRDTN